LVIITSKCLLTCVIGWLTVLGRV